MTTTYTLNGTRIDYFDDGSSEEGDVVGTAAAVFTLTLPDAVTTFSYADAGNVLDPEDETTVFFDQNTTDGIRLDGGTVDEIRVNGGFDDAEVDFTQINWTGGVSYAISFYFVGFEDLGNFDELEYQFFFGAELPFESSADPALANFIASQGSALSLVDPTDPFGEDKPIPLTAIDWDSIVDTFVPGQLLEGDNDADELIGDDGDDTIDAGRGDDTIDGAGGDDDISADGGEDSVEGGAGDDFLRGGRGEDTLLGGAGDDRIVGQRNADTISGGAGEDNLKGGGGNDFIDGGAGNDFIKGGTRADVMVGGDGDDRIAGNSFDDSLDGGAGDDRLNAGGGDDTLRGGTGDDTLKGGSGGDLFIFSAAMDEDLVLDLEAGVDTIQLSSALLDGALTAAQVVDRFGGFDGGRAELDFGGGDEIVFDGITDLGDLEASIVIVNEFLIL
ncbi:MAG: hypothetical protein AAFP13_07810 [Pseudomonadota bacterium]